MLIEDSCNDSYIMISQNRKALVFLFVYVRAFVAKCAKFLILGKNHYPNKNFKTVAMKFESKTPNFTDSIFSVMGKMAVDYDAINLSQGFPNFPSDPALIALVDRAMADGSNQYAPMAGVLDLRKAISHKIEKLHNHRYDPHTEITLTVGATQAIFTIIATTINSEDEVIPHLGVGAAQRR